MRLLLVHGGRVSRALDFQTMRQSHCGRRWWKYHASCSVNLLMCRAEKTEGGLAGRSDEIPCSYALALLRIVGKGIARNSLLLWMEKPVFSLNAPLTLSGHQRLRFHR